ncbi:MAG: BREX system P-loop protein BrxC, partial [Verrucomicrobiales bacterium]
MNKNYELFSRDPRSANLANDGQARLVSEAENSKAVEMLRYELEHFVCEGQYAKGMQRILDSFLGNLSSNAQRASWVSGFYGSGKSHLLKMLCHLWVNTEFADGATARSLAPDLTQDILASLKELDTAGRKVGGGLFAVSGTMPEGSSESARLTVLGILFKSCGFPAAYNQAMFCLYLKDKGFYDKVRKHVEDAGKEFDRELADLYVSPFIRKAVLAADPGLGDEKEVRQLLREQFPSQTDISTSEFIRVTKEVLTMQGGGSMPLTAFILDEVQHYIGDDKDRSRHVTELAEALNKQMDSKVLLVMAGQNALSTDTPQFAWLRDRFTIPVELSDADVETVTRKVLLAKKPQAVSVLDTKLDKCSGEIERQLAKSRIGPNTKDQEYLVADYPILPTRRRFWEAALHAVDPSGSSSLLRTQLRITHEALRAVADEPVGHSIPGDFMFFQQQTPLVQQGVLSREISDRILRLDDGSEKGRIMARTCGLVFLIRKLSREKSVDTGIRANEEMLGDLLVDDLALNGAKVRKELPAILTELVELGVLLFDGEEYNLQTRESAEWDDKFKA